MNVVWPYKIGSAGAKALATALNTKRVRSAGRYVPKPGHRIINWGNSSAPRWPYSPRVTMINLPNNVNVASNKLTAFIAMRDSGVSVPKFDVSKRGLVDQLGGFKPMVLRHILRGTSGAGAQYVETQQALDAAPVAKLYVEYIKKTAEYRVHVAFGKVIDYSVKRKRRDAEADSKIRNLQNGWVFCRDGVELPEAVKNEAIKAVDAVGLDFGAVDVIFNRARGVFVLEVNTAPGLEGRTILSYAAAFGE